MMREDEFLILLLKEAPQVFAPRETVMKHAAMKNASSEFEVLNQRNRQLENFFAHVADALFVTELDGRIVDANPAACALLDYSRDELLALYPWDFVTSATRAEILDLLRGLQRGIPASQQRTYRRKSGQQLTMDLRLTRFQSGESDLVIVSCRDITAQKQLEERFQKSEHNLAEGQRLTKTGSWVLDPKTGETDWSAETCRIFGFPDPPPSPHYSEFRARVHPRDRDAVDQLLIESSQTGEPIPLQYLFVLPDGTEKYIETVSQPVRDESSHVVKLMGTVMDVTQRQQAEANLRAAEELARGQMQALTQTLDAMAQESSPDGFLEHVLCTMIEQLGAFNLSVWERNENDSLSGFEYSRENARNRTPRQELASLFLASHQSPPWLHVLRTRACSICEDVAQAHYLPLREQLMALGIVTILLVPLLVAGEVRGLIGIRFNCKRTFRVEEIELAQALAHQATLAMQLTRLSLQSREAAVVAERNRFARDIHDTLAQGFTGIVVQLEAAEDAISKGLKRAADEHIARASEMARYGLAEARRSVQALRPQLLEENELCAALQSLIQKMTFRTNLTGNFRSQGEPRTLPDGWNEHLLRISQEALTNTIRHAHASHFWARLVFDANAMQLQLRDNGEGFDLQQKRGFGLLGIRERAHEIGGELQIHSTVGEGTIISVALPLALPSKTNAPKS